MATVRDYQVVVEVRFVIDAPSKAEAIQAALLALAEIGETNLAIDGTEVKEAWEAVR